MNVSNLSLSVSGSALTGLNAGFKMAEESASTIARQSVTASAGAPTAARPENDLNGALVQQNEASYLVQANAKGLQFANRALGALLDVMA